jgi:DNA mismatch repair protein MutL
MGFRGEALPSIAAIAQVELVSRREEEELGTKILIEGSKVKKQEACQCPVGTGISVKNLFFNVPARRKFLKSDPVELRHIMDEFHRIALAYPQIFFTLHHNNNEVYHLPKANTRQRIVAILGKNSNEKLVPIDEETDFLIVKGFVGKPQFSKKTRGDQYLFVNNRFIKSNYLNHSIKSAYEELIPKENYPIYFIYMEIAPENIDINVHPTKQEIKFQDERLIYNYIKVATRHALGQYNITPSLDFESDMNFLNNPHNPGRSNEGASKMDYYSPPPKPDKEEVSQWNKMYEDLGESSTSSKEQRQSMTIETQWPVEKEDTQLIGQKEDYKTPYQIHNSMIITQIKSGFLLIDQQAAHERILYERMLEALTAKEKLTQKQLFPKTIELDNARAALLKSILDQINCLGFEIEEFGKNTFILNGIPVGLKGKTDELDLLDDLINSYSENLEMELGIEENIARSMAKSGAVKRGQYLSENEMKELIDQLFACQIPYKSPIGRNCFLTYDLNELKKRFTS